MSCMGKDDYSIINWYSGTPNPDEHSDTWLNKNLKDSHFKASQIMFNFHDAKDAGRDPKDRYVYAISMLLRIDDLEMATGSPMPEFMRVGAYMQKINGSYAFKLWQRLLQSKRPHGR